MRGAHQTLVEHLEILLKKEFDCFVVAQPGEGPFVPALNAIGIRTFVCDQPWWVTEGGLDHWLYCMRRIPKAVDSIRHIIRKEQIDVVYSNAGVSPVGAFAAAEEHKPHIWHVRECFTNPATHLWSPAGQKTLATAIGDFASLLIVTSNHVAHEYLPYVPREKLRVIYDGVNCNRYQNDRSTFMDHQILSLGTTSSAKGLNDLIEAAILLSKSGVKFHVDVLGSFDSYKYRNEVVQRLRRVGVSNEVVLHGWKEDIEKWLSKTNILCCPSHAESFGRSVVEGMAAGCAVVATRCGGPEETVVDGETGYLVGKEDPEALAAALADLLTNLWKTKLMGKKGQERAAEIFDAQKTAAQCAEVIFESLSLGHRGFPPTGIAEMMLAILEHGGPRILLGKKWRFISRFFQVLGKPI